MLVCRDCCLRVEISTCAVDKPRDSVLQQMSSTTAHPSKLRNSIAEALSLADPYERANELAQRLGWNSVGTEVEWTPVIENLGHFALGGFPTSATLVVETKGKPAWEPAWHAGARWCLAPQAGKLQWYDLKNRLEWTGTPDTMTEATLEGFSPASFMQVGQFRPREVAPVGAADMHDESPGILVTEKINEWWTEYLRIHARAKQTANATQIQKDEFTRFVAGMLLLRTIEDLDRVKWLRPASLRKCSDEAGFQKLVGRAAKELNSRVLHGMSMIPFELAKKMIDASYEIHVDFAALDVDPVGAFYEEILGVGVEHQEKAQKSLFGEDVKTTKVRTARRNKGVYYTPRIYANTLARMTVRPRIRVAEDIHELPVIADIAAGSGELLCAALREILCEPAWGQPEVAWNVLDSKLQAIDENPLALQLCALNLLRTAIRHVPELLTWGQRLPSLEQNLRSGNALLKKTLDDVAPADVVLINPPFHAPNHWRLPDSQEAIPELGKVNAHPHSAMAFFAAAMRLAKPGAAMGVVMPSMLFTGPQSAPWRAWIAEHVRLDMVVSNLGTPFRDVHSYAGLVVGQKQVNSKQWRPRTRVVQIHGLVQGEQWDTGVLLADTTANRTAVESRIISAVLGASPNWLGLGERKTLSSGGKKALLDIMSDTFHQGVVLAPALWSEKLFAFRDESPSRVRHEWSGRVIDRSSLLRPLVKSKKVTGNVPLWCEPRHAGRWAFVPPCVGQDWFDIRGLSKSDPAGYRIARLILECILGDADKVDNDKTREFVEEAQQGRIRFRAPNGYQDNALPLVYASRTSVTTASRGQGRTWYAWVNLEGTVLPASGLQMRVPRPQFAAALVAWMSLDECVQGLIETGAPRRDGSVEFILARVASWAIPDLREDRLQNRLDELYASFLAYREEAAGLDPKQALDLVSYREVQALALALWNEG